MQPMTRLSAVIALVASLGLVSGTAADAAQVRPERAAHVYKDFVPTASDPAELRAAWRKWQQLDASAYTLRVQNYCYCLDRPPLDTAVSDDEVTSVTYQGRTRELRRKGYDMDRMFLILRDAYAHAARLDVQYSDRGIPYRITIDWELLVADEEANYSVRLRGLHD
jgi:hypothetical protein